MHNSFIYSFTLFESGAIAHINEQTDRQTDSVCLCQTDRTHKLTRKSDTETQTEIL